MNKLVVRSFLTGSTIEEIDHLENVVIPDTPLNDNDDDDDECLVADRTRICLHLHQL